MLPPLATLDDLRLRLPADVDIEDTSRAAAALEDASALVRDEAKTTWTDAAGDIFEVPEIVRTIVLQVALRSLDRSFVYGADGQVQQQDGGLYLKADEKARLAAARRPPASTFGSARLSTPFGWPS